MAVIEYSVKENNNLGTHSVFTVAKSFSTLDFSDLAAEVVETTGSSPGVVKMILERYTEVAIRSVLRGHRVKMGDLLTIYPQLSCSVKDEVDADGNVTRVATPDMINVANGRASVGATISQAVSEKFRSSVSWKRSNGKDDDDTTTTDPDSTGGSGSGDNTSGGGGDDGPGDNEG